MRALGSKAGTVNSSDYLIDVLLVALVLRQIVPRILTPRSVLLPLVLLAFAGSEYLKGFPTTGNDLLMEVILILVGAAFGVVSGLTTKVWTAGSGQVMAKAGIVAASVWVLGMGIRLAFDVWAHTTAGEVRLLHFSIHHSITTADAYSTGFVLMAFAQVLIRVGILQFRRIRLVPVSLPQAADAR